MVKKIYIANFQQQNRFTKNLSTDVLGAYTQEADAWEVIEKDLYMVLEMVNIDSNPIINISKNSVTLLAIDILNTQVCITWYITETVLYSKEI